MHLRAVTMSTNVEAYPEADRGVSTTLGGLGEESLVMQGGLKRGEMKAARQGSDNMVVGSPPLVGSGTCVRVRLCLLTAPR